MIINVKTEYDFLRSICQVDDIIDYAKDNKLSEVGICDPYNTFAAFDFYEKCTKENIKPIIGCQIHYENQCLLVYAKNNDGFKRINELLSMDEVEFNDFENDIIIIVEKGWLIDDFVNNKDLQQIYDFLNFLSPEDIYIGVISYLNDTLNYSLFEICNMLNCQYIYIDQVRYLSSSDFKPYLCLRAIEKQTTINSLQEIKYKRHCVTKYLNSENEYYQNFISKINLNLHDISARLLKYDDGNSKLRLSTLAYAGLKKRDKIDEQVYLDRIKYELEIIDHMGYNDYFLIVWDIVVYAHKNNIAVGPGRGSAAASLVSYSLGITQIDPIINDLLFERFLNPKRKTMPDIDLDFEDNKREEIVEYIISRFSNGAKISTISRLLAKSAFRDVAKANDWKNSEITLFSKELNSAYSYEENLMNNNKLAKEYQKNINFRTISDYIIRLENLARQESIHAAGVIISDKDLHNFAVVRDNVIFQEAKTLENIGLLKIDILALSNLTLLKNIVNRVNKRNVNEIVLNKIPLDDIKTYELLSTGNTLGIFQLESKGVREVLVKLKPTNFDELANILALYRPGPMQYIDDYQKNKNNFVVKTPVDEILKNSYGIMIYQEQIMQIANYLANYSYAESDILRRAISKKDEQLLLSAKADFISKSINNGFEKSYVEKIYADILKFADYGFNKAHAYSYAKIAYQMAYLKTYFPSIYISEIFKLHFNGSKREEMLLELKKLNIKIISPNILTSDVNVAAYRDSIILGLTNIKGISKDEARIIIKNRDLIKNKEDFLDVVNSIFCNLTLSELQIDNIVNSGAFDRFGYNRETLRFYVNHIYKSIGFIRLDDITIAEKESKDITFESRLEYASIKINLVYDLFDIEYSKVKTVYKNLLTIDDAYKDYEFSRDSYKLYHVFLNIKRIKEITTKKGDLMSFITAFSGSEYDVTVFSDVYSRIKDKIEVEAYYICSIKLNNDKIYLQEIKL